MGDKQNDSQKIDKNQKFVNGGEKGPEIHLCS